MSKNLVKCCFFFVVNRGADQEIVDGDVAMHGTPSPTTGVTTRRSKCLPKSACFGRELDKENAFVLNEVSVMAFDDVVSYVEVKPREKVTTSNNAGSLITI